MHPWTSRTEVKREESGATDVLITKHRERIILDPWTSGNASKNTSYERDLAVDKVPTFPTAPFIRDHSKERSAIWRFQTSSDYFLATRFRLRVWKCFLKRKPYVDRIQQPLSRPDCVIMFPGNGSVLKSLNKITATAVETVSTPFSP